MKTEKKNIKISLIINLIVVILTIIASVMMFAGFRPMKGAEPVLETTKLGMFKFFTVDSNILVGIVSLIFVIDNIKILRGKLSEISEDKYVLKLMATSAVGLTFFVVFTYLGPISEGGILSMLRNSNLFFHLMIPLLSILGFIYFEKNDKLKFKHTFYGIIPSLLYQMYYLINVLVHMENGKVSPVYDWYWFVQNGIWTAVIVAPVMLLLSYAISFTIYKFVKKESSE